MFKFVGGAYDGVVLDVNDVNLYTTVIHQTQPKIITMPPLSDWEPTKRGDRSKDDSYNGMPIHYEVIHSQNHAECRLLSDDRFEQILFGGGTGNGRPISHVEFTGQYFKCCQHVPSLPSEYVDLTDDKERVWQCVAISKHEFENDGGFLQIADLLGGEPSANRPRIVSIACNDVTELRTKLSDVID